MGTPTSTSRDRGLDTGGISEDKNEGNENVEDEEDERFDCCGRGDGVGRVRRHGESALDRAAGSGAGGGGAEKACHRAKGQADPE